MAPIPSSFRKTLGIADPSDFREGENVVAVAGCHAEKTQGVAVVVHLAQNQRAQ